MLVVTVVLLGVVVGGVAPVPGWLEDVAPAPDGLEGVVQARLGVARCRAGCSGVEGGQACWDMCGLLGKFYLVFIY